MFNDITNIVRSNQNAVMFRIGNGCASSAIYSIVDVKTQKTIKVGTRDAVSYTHLTLPTTPYV